MTVRLHRSSPVGPARRTFVAALALVATLGVVGCDARRDSTTAQSAPRTAGPVGAGGVGTLPVGVPEHDGGVPEHDGIDGIDAKAYAVFDVTNDRWLAESSADTPLPVGSIMKLLTAYVVMEAGALDRVVTVPELTIGPDESIIGLYEGEQLPRDVLLRAMLIVSANDAARALAIDVGGSDENFVSRMNLAAQQLGMSRTVAANPVGLDAEGAHSSAHDMITLAALLMRDDVFRAAVIRPSATLHGETFPATNDLLGSYPGATGVKTGHTTQAGYCLIGSATRDGRDLIVAVLGAPSGESRRQSVIQLLDWGFTHS